MQAVRPVLEQARRKHERQRRLLAAGAVAKEQEEVALEALQQYEAERKAAEARVAYSRHELDVTSAAAKAPSGSVMTLRAPVSGVVLRRFEQQERLLPAGTPVVDIGDPTSADIIADVVSMDAVSIRPGMQAFVERWGGADVLHATVRRVEPAARTVVSALGIEERRVYVTLALDTMALALGDNYKVDTRIRLWRRPSVLTVPLSALLRDGASWHVFVVANNRAERKRVTLGMRTSLVAEITSGLQEGDRVIIHPPAVLTNNSRVREW
jgi:HlyD family secretion protein